MSTTKSTTIDTVRVAPVGSDGRVLPAFHEDVVGYRVCAITASGDQWLHKTLYASGPVAIRMARNILDVCGPPSTWIVEKFTNYVKVQS